MNRFRRQSIAAAAALLAAPGLVQSQSSYPDKGIRIVVPFGAGTATDFLTRTLSEPLSKALGQPVIVDNKPGGNSAIGTSFVAKAPADGYTLLLASNAGIVASPAGMADVNYDPVADLRYISLIGSIHYVLVVNNQFDTRVKTAKDLVDYLKRNPGKFNYGSGNTGAIAYMGHMAATYGLNVAHIPYKSTPPAVVDLIGDQVQLMVLDVSSALPRLKDGKIRALGVPTASRHPLLPDVPTYAESGLATPPDMSGWFALSAPTGTPDAILDRLNTEIVKILNTDNIRTTLLNGGITATPSTRDEATRYHKEQLATWIKLVKQLNLRLN